MTTTTVPAALAWADDRADTDLQPPAMPHGPRISSEGCSTFQVT